MSVDLLREEIAIQLELLDATVREIEALCADLGSRQPTVRERAAAAAFLADFYTGVENILKRISRYCGVALPAGDDWHTELFNRFCEPPLANLPVVFDAAQRDTMAAYRRFRHVIRHGYVAQLDWDRMAVGVEDVGRRYAALKAKLHTLFGV
jgi:hypothetical protein